jgi:hypothetical protein
VGGKLQAERASTMIDTRVNRMNLRISGSFSLCNSHS